MGTPLAPSITYLPQIDGQYERVTKWVEEYLSFCHDTQKSWDKWLALAEFCYNNTKHLSIGMSPFEVMYGCKVGMPSLIADMMVKNQQARNDLESMGALLQLAKKNMQDAQAKEKKYADDKGGMCRDLTVCLGCVGGGRDFTILCAIP